MNPIISIGTISFYGISALVIIATTYYSFTANGQEESKSVALLLPKAESKLTQKRNENFQLSPEDSLTRYKELLMFNKTAIDTRYGVNNSDVRRIAITRMTLEMLKQQGITLDRVPTESILQVDREVWGN